MTTLQTGKEKIKELEKLVKDYVDSKNEFPQVPHYDQRKPENIACTIAWKISRAIGSDMLFIPDDFQYVSIMRKIGLCDTNGKLTDNAIKLYTELKEWYEWDDVLF